MKITTQSKKAMTRRMLHFVLTLVAGGFLFQAHAQSRLNGGIGFIGGLNHRPGLLIEIEHEKLFSEDFSMPLRFDVGMISTPEYNSMVFELHKGFRYTFPSGFFAEQSLGLGALSMSNKQDSPWLVDDYGHVIAYGQKAAWGLTPSVTLGLGYKLKTKKGARNLLWIRPKIYWNLAFASLDTPYAQVQIGFTKNFK